MLMAMKKKKEEELFDHGLRRDLRQNAPLAARMRPMSLDEFVGQDAILGEGSVLRRAIREDTVGSVIFWGPPGSGKTTLARIIARESKSQFFPLSAVSAGVADLREVVRKARELRSLHGMKSILFIDEIHRFNKAQQDAVLPFVENGIVNLIGATTENPSFEVNSALISRCRVYTLKRLTEEQVEAILKRALADGEKGLGRYEIRFEDDAWGFLLTMAQGDARVALNALEMAVLSAPSDTEGLRTISLAHIEDTIQHRATLYDKRGEMHYDLISALHKSMRNSDPDAALYWLGRMIEGGEDPLYIARRIVRFASEDVGLSDPQALTQALSAFQAVHFIGLPEGNLALAQAVVYMALARKSNALYRAMNSVRQDIVNLPQYPVPMVLRNAVTRLMKEEGYGKGYKYAHDFDDHYAPMECMPDNLKGKRYFHAQDAGWEKEALERLEALKETYKANNSRGG
jgi:putative ATPase